MKKKNESEVVTFNCDICDKKYNCRKNIFHHMKTHLLLKETGGP
jgi:hypothetical protein